MLSPTAVSRVVTESVAISLSSALGWLKPSAVDLFSKSIICILYTSLLCALFSMGM